MKLIYRSFEEWWEEYGRHQLSPFPESTTKDTFRKVWTFGWISSENTADGHTAEAQKDVRNGGWREAAELIETKSMPSGRRAIDSNIKEMAGRAGLK